MSAAGKLPASVVSPIKLNFCLVSYSDTRCLQGGTAHANAEAAASDEHVAPREGTPLSEPAIRIWRRPPRSVTRSMGMSITARPPGLSSRQRRMRPRNSTTNNPVA